MAQTLTKPTTELMQKLFLRGLGELFVLHVHEQETMLGKLVLSKGRIVLADAKYLAGVKPNEVASCWEAGLLGMVSASEQYEWESLTFYGLHQCRVQVDLSQTRGGRISGTQNQEGESLVDFIGSVYRGYQLMLDHHFLPVVLLQSLQAKNGDWGLVVADLRMAAIDLSAIRVVNDIVRQSVQRHLELGLVEQDVKDQEFEELFGNFLPPRPAVAESTPPKLSIVAPKPVPKPPVRAAAPASATPVPAPAAPAARAEPQKRSQAVAATAPREIPPAIAAVSGTTVISHVLGLLGDVIREIGPQRGFPMFEQWATRALTDAAAELKKKTGVTGQTPREYFDAVSPHLQQLGERYSVVQQSDKCVQHEIHDCVFREACRHSGVDAEGRWSTCAQAIPDVRSRAAAALDPRLDWTWTSCDRRAGYPCVFELKFRERS